MKYFVLVATLAMFAFTTPAKKNKVIFFGDSITQAAVKGNGYIVKLDSIIKKEGLAESFELSGAGIGGNKVYDLYLRMETDVLEKNPDIVFIYVGINDVWHKSSSGTGTDAPKFIAFYKAIIKKLQDRNIRVVVCTPSVIGERNDFSNEQDEDLNHYSNIIRNIAKESNLPVVDLRKAFVDYEKANNPTNQEKGILTTDRVHLNDAGNLFVAGEMWKVLKALK
ncbi:GDSL-type esterase/lipase family protein [Terrimonas sp. NA20]|uniref:GDSL-type esterase/lipase family protein n=1 Tax=Terrimonas ginsenosidimutans TaxID=2908004 RepID=A0ABS9KND2_9BACT|nr:GDSL-type esterase/lipase family protein [Terrimonas ginsenosidimutans]MCG2613825.1 GDSL-type esterase/lipase family protein [Terrimonas ginsenosidimutans]